MPAAPAVNLISPPAQLAGANPVAGPSTFRPAPLNGDTQRYEETDKDVEMMEIPMRPDQSQAGRRKCFDYHGMIRCPLGSRILR